MLDRLRSALDGSGPSSKYWRRAALFGGGLLLLFLAVQLVGMPAGPPAEAPPAEAAPGYDLLSWGNLIALLLLAGGVALAIRLQRNPTQQTRGGQLKQIESLPVGEGATVQLVACGERLLLIGVTGQQISVLQELHPDDLPLDEVEPAPAANDHFATLLRKQFGSSVHA